MHISEIIFTPNPKPMTLNFDPEKYLSTKYNKLLLILCICLSCSLLHK